MGIGADGARTPERGGQSKFWEKGSVKMDRLEEFSAELYQGEKLISFGMVGEYRHVHLHKAVLKLFLFHYSGKTNSCFSLPLDGAVRLYITRDSCRPS